MPGRAALPNAAFPSLPARSTGRRAVAAKRAGVPCRHCFAGAKGPELPSCPDNRWRQLHGLILRSDAQHCVSKDSPARSLVAVSWSVPSHRSGQALRDAAPRAAPQDEGGLGLTRGRKWRRKRLKRLNSRAEVAWRSEASAPNIWAAGGRAEGFRPQAGGAGASLTVGIPRKLQILVPNPLKTLARRRNQSARAGSSVRRVRRPSTTPAGTAPPRRCGGPRRRRRRERARRSPSAQSGLPSLRNATSIDSTALRAAATAPSSLPRTTIWLLKRPSLYDG
jgi:hypothetical protein